MPVLVLILFAAAPYWLNSKVHSQVTKEINANSKLSPAERDDRLAAFSRIDFAAVCRDNPPEFAQLRTALVKAGVAGTYEHLRWALNGSVVLVGLLLTASGIMFALSLAARKSPHDLIRYYRLGWRFGMAVAFVQVLLLIPLMTYGVYEFPVLWTDSWYPQLVLVIVVVGLVALWRSIAILMHKVPLKFNEPMSRRITAEQAPELWQAVRDAASRLQTAPPDNIIIGIQLNFYVTELAVWDGHELAKGRTLFLSYPLLKQLPEEEIIAIIGHELGHFIGDDTRLTREFYPLKLKAHATLITLAQSVWVGWTSLHFLNFFGWCFGETERAVSRKRELLADEKAAALTSREIAARALVRFHVLIEAFQQGLVDTVRKGAQSPLDVPLYTVVREKLPAGVPFWTELFEKKLPHPLDTHPALQVRLEALGQAMDSREAEVLTTQETGSAYSRWFVNRDELFAEIRRLADAVVQKMQSKARILDANYESAEGRELLDRHFPERKWGVSQSKFWVMVGILGAFAATFWVLTAILSGDNLVPGIIFGLVGVLSAYGCGLIWLRHRNAEFILKADGVNYTGWKRPLRFQDVEHLSGRQANSSVTLTFRLKNPQPPIWKYTLLGWARKKVTFSLSGLDVPKQAKVAETIFRYYTRQTQQ
ncbi:MAG: hypothetical protein JWQ04_2147 [Pedosphaera sp.]|nr:hypothetical protein [Pedosphaera sp.]